MNSKLKGSLYLLTATLIWGTTFVAQSVGMDHVGPISFQAIRTMLAALFLCIVIFITEKGRISGFLSHWRNPRLWKAGLLCGAALFLAANLQQLGLVQSDAGKAGFITAMYIVLVPVFGIFLKKKPPLSCVFSVAIAMVGLYMLSGAGINGISTGDIYLALCAVAFAVQITLIDRYAADLEPIALNCIQALTCSILSFCVVPFTETITLSGVLEGWFPLCYAGVLSMGIAYSLQIMGQQKLESTKASLIMSLESVFAAIAGALLLHERMTTMELAGCALVFAGVLISQIPSKKTK